MSDLKRFSAVYIAGGAARRMTFEAFDLAEAQVQALQWGVGVEGETAGNEEQLPPPEAYDMETTCALLGGISPSTVYRMYGDGRLDRVAGVSTPLTTRRSMEKLGRLGRS